jgi:hypothetical protein
VEVQRRVEGDVQEGKGLTPVGFSCCFAEGVFGDTIELRLTLLTPGCFVLSTISCFLDIRFFVHTTYLVRIVVVPHRAHGI